MAAQDYYQSFQRPQGPPYPTSSHPPKFSSPQPQQQQYLNPAAPFQSPQPWNPPQGPQYPAPALYNQGAPPQRPGPSVSQASLMPPLQPNRSLSEPPENRRMSLDQGHHHHHHHHHHSRHHSRSRSRSRHSSHSRHHRSHSRSSHRSSDRSSTRSRARSNRDTFLGAGGGAILGDSLFPGLGTLGGALLGGLGGHKYADKSARRSKSDVADGDRRKYRDGVTVHGSWGIER